MCKRVKNTVVDEMGGGGLYTVCELYYITLSRYFVIVIKKYQQRFLSILRIKKKRTEAHKKQFFL